MGGISLIQLNYRDSKPIYEQIKDGFRKLVISGSLLADEKLPSVRELASSLAINPNVNKTAAYTIPVSCFFFMFPLSISGCKNEKYTKNPAIAVKAAVNKTIIKTNSPFLKF